MTRPIRESTIRVAERWEKMPKGWTSESRKEFWNALTGDNKHKVTKCMKEMEGKVDNTGAFCGALADRVDPGWRSRTARKLAHRYAASKTDIIRYVKPSIVDEAVSYIDVEEILNEIGLSSLLDGLKVDRGWTFSPERLFIVGPWGASKMDSANTKLTLEGVFSGNVSFTLSRGALRGTPFSGRVEWPTSVEVDFPTVRQKILDSFQEKMGLRSNAA